MSNTLRTFLPLAILVSILIGYNFIGAAWTPATGVPPASNTEAPLNVSATTQAKTGNLSSNIFAALTEMRSNRYCDALGQNCFVANNPDGLPTCAEGQTLVADAAGAWICGAQAAVPPTTLWLVNNQHTEGQCTSLGGIVQGSGANKFCRFTMATCPAGWAKYQNWTATANRTCTSPGGPPLCQYSSCSVTGHGFSNTAVESCSYTIGIPFGQGGGSDGHKGCDRSPGTCTAPVAQIGCY